MQETAVDRIRANPKYQELKRKRNVIGWTLTILMLIVYFGYVSLIAFDKSFLAQKLSDTGVTSIGVPIGLAIIIFTIAITGYYVRRANSEFDDLTTDIIKEAK